MADSKVVLFTGTSNDNLLAEKRSVLLPVDELKQNLDEFMSQLEEILPSAEDKPAGLGLKSVTVALGIDAKGKVGFLGTGVEVSGSATLTLTFEKPVR